MRAGSGEGHHCRHPADDAGVIRSHWRVTVPGYPPFTLLGRMTRQQAIDHVRGIWPLAEVTAT